MNETCHIWRILSQDSHHVRVTVVMIVVVLVGLGHVWVSVGVGACVVVSLVVDACVVMDATTDSGISVGTTVAKVAETVGRTCSKTGPASGIRFTSGVGTMTRVLELLEILMVEFDHRTGEGEGTIGSVVKELAMVFCWPPTPAAPVAVLDEVPVVIIGAFDVDELVTATVAAVWLLVDKVCEVTED